MMQKKLHLFIIPFKTLHSSEKIVKSTAKNKIELFNNSRNVIKYLRFITVLGAW